MDELSLPGNPPGRLNENEEPGNRAVPLQLDPARQRTIARNRRFSPVQRRPQGGEGTPDAVFDCSHLSSRHAHTAPFTAGITLRRASGRPRTRRPAPRRTAFFQHAGACDPRGHLRLSARSHSSGGPALFGPTCLIEEDTPQPGQPAQGFSSKALPSCIDFSITVIALAKGNRHVSRRCTSPFPEATGNRAAMRS